MRNSLVALFVLAGCGGPVSSSTNDLSAIDAAGPDLGARDLRPADGGTSRPAGAGKSTYACPIGGIDIAAGADAAVAINAASAGATLCIHGPHYASAPIRLKSNQTLIGVDTNARLSGATPLTGWVLDSPGVWRYDGALALKMHTSAAFGGKVSCYSVAIYQDDLFLDDQRLLRVLSLAQLTGAMPPGQAQTPAESTTRFFFDYVGHHIYMSQDPTGHTVELATMDTLITGAGANGVTLENLFLEKTLTANIDGTGGRSWTLWDVTLRFAHLAGFEHFGGTAAAPTTLTRVLATNNGQYGLASSGTWVTIVDSELSWNNIANYRAANDNVTDDRNCGGYWGAGACKFVLTSGGSSTTPSLVVKNLDSHDNLGDGFWTDIGNQYVSIQGGRFHDNERTGYFHEISCDIEITGGEFDHNGRPIKNTDQAGWGITLSDSNNANVHGNTIHDNGAGGVNLIFQASHTGISKMPCVTAANDADTTNVLKNDTIADNDVFMCAAGSTTGARYNMTVAMRANTFTGNRYRVADLTGSWWFDATPKTWTAWRANGNDTTGSAVTPCTFP